MTSDSVSTDDAPPSYSEIFVRGCVNAKTQIFWDIEDFPIPDGLDPKSVCQKIKQGLDFRGDVSISAYYEDKTVPEEVLDKYRDARITLHPYGGKSTRLDNMILDILLWSMDNPSDYYHPLNLVVISRNISKETLLNNVLQSCTWTEYNVVVVLPDNFASQGMPPLPGVNSSWLWKSLLDGGEPIDQSLIDPLVDPLELVDLSRDPTFYCEVCDGPRPTGLN
ncbi:NYN domain limkain-b1-type [Arabidopsis thaliana x Arabidopsis arenosa]|uniref:NYN domain limkain-b1-type n=1 Tax=Arabidopsis thaliana x Arabidopsis arenosa TaxID=1240361 RepID=A0A8T1ZSB7_9BRAS|nr:NYN domain limkain-b1-type [Arabidopsis thaliana x Arabidopsis arenosa]